MRDVKIKSAIVFQFSLLLILSITLFMYKEFAEIILGALVGMLVGIGTENIDKIPEQRRDENE